jgi:hypothetical protein
MTPEQTRFIAEDAKQLLDNKMLKEAFEAVSSYIDQQALSCEPDNKDRAQRIVLSKQLLAGIKREIYRHVESGQVANIQIAELEKKKRAFPFMR